MPRRLEPQARSCTLPSKAREQELVDALERMRQAGAEMAESARKGHTLLVKREAELLEWSKALQAHIDDKLLPRIKALEARDAELVAKVNTNAKHIKDEVIPEFSRLLNGQNQAADEAARAAGREKALEAWNATLAEGNERLRADLVAARHESADADEAGRALQDGVESLERDAHDRQEQVSTPALAPGA